MTIQGTHSSRRINQLIAALNYKDYLEVGVSKGDTFLAVEAANRTGVDPNFIFDYRQHQGPSVKFFEITSDRFFSNTSPEKRFDLFFLDGLHTFEQILRDFLCSMSCARDDSLWIVDDTVPNDVYSALPTQGQALRFRAERSSTPDGSWHGDVFKFVFALHDFFPMLSYCTINTGGNPQTVVWRESRTDFAPKFNSVEAISRLSYFDFRSNDPVMRYQTEADGLKRAIQGIQNIRALNTNG